MKPTFARCGFVLLSLFLIELPAASAQQTPPPNAQGAATQPAPGSTRPAGAGTGRRGRGAPMTDAEKAEIAPLAELPRWMPGAGDGNYSIGPEYAPCPEMTPRDGVPVGKVASFTLEAKDSKF